jgi:hypothetical protein
MRSDESRIVRDMFRDTVSAAVRSVRRELEEAAEEVLVAGHRRPSRPAGKRVREDEADVSGRQSFTVARQCRVDRFRFAGGAQPIATMGGNQHAFDAARSRRPAAVDVPARGREEARTFCATRCRARYAWRRRGADSHGTHHAHEQQSRRNGDADTSSPTKSGRSSHGNDRSTWAAAGSHRADARPPGPIGL